MKGHEKLVSIIIPTYKRNSVPRAIKSILNQTYKNYEIIVVNDNNSDTHYSKKLDAVMEVYKSNPNIKYVKHNQNKNGAAARNTGISFAKGDYIAFLDDDDYYLPNRLAILVSKLERNKEYDAIYSSSVTIQNGKIVAIGKAKLSGSFQKELLLEKFEIFTGSNLFFSRKAIIDINGFDESFIRHQDLEVMVRFFDKYKILAVDEILVVKNGDAAINLPPSHKFLEIKVNYFNKFKNIINLMNESEKKELYRTHYYSVIQVCIRDKNKETLKEAKKKLREHTHLKLSQHFQIFLEIINTKIKIQYFKKYYQHKRLLKMVEQVVWDVVEEYEK